MANIQLYSDKTRYCFLEYALVDEDDIEESMTETRSEEKPAVEEDLSHFGEIVNDDEDVFGENCESDTEDSFH